MSQSTVPARRRPSAWIAMGLLGLALGSALLGVVVALSLGGDSDFEEFGMRGSLFLALSVVTFASMGTIVAVRLPSNTIGWLLLGVGVGFGVAFVGGLTLIIEGWPGSTPVTRTMIVIGLLAWYLIFTTLVPRLLLVFPDGRLLSPRWRWVDVVHVVVIALGVVFITSPSLKPRVTETSGIEVIAEVVPLSLALMLLLAGAGVLAMVMRFRRSNGVERLQIKWMALAGILLVLGVTITSLVRAISTDLAELVGSILNGIPPLLPIAIGIAVMRYRLYEIDRIISRTIGWAVVTGLLVGAFALLVVGSSAVLEPLTGGNTLAVAGSTLVVALLFNPVRSRVQGAVNRRFDRSRYDGERTLAAFGERLRDEVDLTTIRADVLGTVETSVRPTRVGLWLRRPEGEA